MRQALRFREDGSFKLLQFTDIHYTNDDEADHKTVQLMREILAAEKPDFVMVTGDTVYGEKNLELLPLAVAPLTESGIPWSLVFGNHDGEFAGNKRELFDAVKELPGFIGYDDPQAADGIGNHTLEIMGKDQEARWLIVGLDSGDYNPLKKVGGYGYVTRNQIQWYRKKIQEQKQKSSDFGAMIFQHIPLPEYEQLFRYGVTYGLKHEEVCFPYLNSGFFSAILEEGCAAGVFAGHDHVNDFYGDWFGVTLGYGRATGFGTYGAPDFAKGARIFILRENETKTFETYERLENGVVITQPWKYEPRERLE